jgi:hypothetical protein
VVQPIGVQLHCHAFGLQVGLLKFEQTVDGCRRLDAPWVSATPVTLIDTILEADVDRHSLLQELETAPPERLGEIYGRLIEIDADTLQERRRIVVADHIGCVAASGQTLVAGNWDSRLLYVFDLAGGRPERVVHNPSATHYQDMKFAGGQLVAGGNTSWLTGTVDWIDYRTMKVIRSVKAGAVGPIRPVGRGGPNTGEGFAIEGRELYVLPEDGPSRVFHFRLDA